MKKVNPTCMARARRLGMPVRPWTVDKEDEMQRLSGLGVDTLITDVPDTLAALIK